MEATVLRRVLHGLSANAYSQCITVLVQLVGVPLLLHAWGTQLYGEWLILFAIPSYLSMTDLGFSQSAGNDMTARVGGGDRPGALTVFQSLGALVYALAATGLLLVSALLWHLPLQDWFQFRAMDASTARWVLWLLAAEVFARLPNGVNHAGFRASGEYALHVGLESTTRFLQFAGIWGAAAAGGGPLASAAVFCGVRALSTAGVAILLVHRHRWLRFGLAQARKRELRRLFRPAMASMAIPVAQALNIQGMVLVIGAVLGPLAVVVFSTLRTLTRLALQMVSIVSHSAEPEFAVAYGAGNHELVQSLFVHALRAGLWLALTAAASLALFGSLAVEVWTHGKVAMEPALFACLLGSAVVSVVWYSSLIALKAANRHLRAAALFVLTAAAAVATSALLLEWTGAIATAGLALLLMDVVMSLFMLRGATRLMGSKPLACLAQAANPWPMVRLALSKGRQYVP